MVQCISRYQILIPSQFEGNHKIEEAKSTSTHQTLKRFDTMRFKMYKQETIRIVSRNILVKTIFFVCGDDSKGS